MDYVPESAGWCRRFIWAAMLACLFAGTTFGLALGVLLTRTR